MASPRNDQSIRRVSIAHMPAAAELTQSQEHNHCHICGGLALQTRGIQPESICRRHTRLSRPACGLQVCRYFVIIQHRTVADYSRTTPRSRPMLNMSCLFPLPGEWEKPAADSRQVPGCRRTCVPSARCKGFAGRNFHSRSSSGFVAPCRLCASRLRCRYRRCE